MQDELNGDGAAAQEGRRVTGSQGCDCVIELNDVDPALVVSARSKAQSAKKLHAKRSIVKHGPLKIRSSKQPTEAQTFGEKHIALLEQLEAVKVLPKNSAYARHRKLTLEKALVLLDKSR